MGRGFVTVLAGSVVGSSNELSGLGGDGRAYWMAGALATGAVLGALLDSGASLPENAEYNRGLHRGFAESVRDAQEENRRLRDTYRATVRYEEAGK
jgi:hypothetical protein